MGERPAVFDEKPGDVFRAELALFLGFVLAAHPLLRLQSSGQDSVELAAFLLLPLSGVLAGGAVSMSLRTRVRYSTAAGWLTFAAFIILTVLFAMRVPV